MTPDDVVSFLRSTELLGTLPDAALAAVARQVEVLEVPEGTVLFEEGSTGHAAYLVVAGEIALVAGGMELLRRGPGGVVGEFSLIDDQPRSASGLARTPMKLLVWQRRAFQASVVSEPVVARGILRMLTRKLRYDVEQGVGLRRERERWRHDLAASREIQSGILPERRISVPGLEVAGHCAPVGEVGGDFYDVLAFDGQRTGILIEDVTGAGFHATLVVAMTKSALHAHARHDASPGSVMDTVRRTLALSPEWSMMMSCAYVLLDPLAGCLTYANAGHPYPLHWSAREGTITPLDALDVILGVQEVDEVQYSSRRASWEDGDLLVLYSDGVTEARATSGEMFGRAGLERALAGLCGAGALHVRDGLLAAVHEHLDGAPEDDVTLVVARSTGTGEPS